MAQGISWVREVPGPEEFLGSRSSLGLRNPLGLRSPLGLGSHLEVKSSEGPRRAFTKSLASEQSRDITF